jgi:Ca2+-binding RTX toxin-like protein
MFAAAPDGAPIVAGTDGNDVLHTGQGGNVLVGGAGADSFVFEAAVLNAPALAGLAHIADYSAAEGDIIDLSVLLAGVQGMKVTDAMLVRTHEDASGTFATLQANIDVAHGQFWVDLAQLDGVHGADTVNVVLWPAHVAQLHADWLV